MASFSELMMKVVDGQQLSPIEREQMRQYTSEMDTNNQLVSSWQQVNKKIRDVYLDLPIVTIYSEVLSNSIPSLTISIPSDYKHLFVFASAVTDRAATSDWVHGRFNDDTGTNYMEGYTGESAGSASGWVGEQLTRDDFGVVFASGSTATNGAAGSATLFIPHYNSGIWKTVLKIQGFADANTAFLASFTVWKDKSPIRKFTIFPEFGTNLVSGSAFSILGIK